MRQKKIVLTTDFQDHNEYDLFAIHSPSEDFFLAFQLNKTLGTRFINVTERIKPQADIPFFSRFVCALRPEEAKWELISNHFTSVAKSSKENQLFSTLIEEHVLIPSLSKVDYFLKVPKENLTPAIVVQLQRSMKFKWSIPLMKPK